jgi:hypothetical protein
MDGGRCESSLAERRRGRGIDFGNSDADEDAGYVTRSKPSTAVRGPKRSREETDPSLRKGADVGVCKVDLRGDEFLFLVCENARRPLEESQTHLLLGLKLGVEGEESRGDSS